MWNLILVLDPGLSDLHPLADGERVDALSGRPIHCLMTKSAVRQYLRFPRMGRFSAKITVCDKKTLYLPE